MKISVSFLSIKDNIEENIKKLDNTTVDFLHVDIMDGIFVSNTTKQIDEIYKLLKDTKKPKDVHLMVSNIKKYVDEFTKLNPTYITVHLEALTNPIEEINYIKSKGVKVGLSIKPNTDFNELLPYLNYVDLILIMTVEPGMGGQKFIDEQINKIDRLKKYQEKYHYLIEVDGGINDETIKLCNSDIAVIGSYITASDNYQVQIDKVKYE